MRPFAIFVFLMVVSVSTPASAQGEAEIMACQSGDRAACMRIQFGNCGHDNPRVSINECTRRLTEQDNRRNTVHRRFERSIMYVFRADAYAKRGDLDRAIEDYDRAITSVGDEPWIHALRAIALRRAGDYEGALASYDEASALAPEDANYYLAKAWLHTTVGQYQSALTSYDDAIAIEPESAVFLVARAWLMSTSPDDQVRNGEQAIADALAAINLESDIPPVYLDTLAAAYAESGNFEKAVEIQQWMLSLLRSSPRESNQRAIELYENRLELYLQEMPYREIRCASITLGDTLPYCQFEIEVE